jgi:LysR family glycine cleavage system transcriptional activator
MKRTLPPLLALRAFESAARHLSFSKAGDELNVTQGAISRQIKILEEFLNAFLFNRLTRQVELTPFGQSYLNSISLAFDEIEKATTQFIKRSRSLSISILPSIGTLWLMQRLTAFACAYPEIHLHISSSLDPANFKHDHVDLAVRVGKLPGQVYPAGLSQIDFQMVESWTGITASHLWDDYLTPVCSKKLIDKIGPLESLEDLNRFRLIHNDSRADGWPAWLKANNASHITGAATIHVGHSFLAVNAAREGLGVACVPTIEIEKVDWRCELVMPFDSQVQSAGAYYLLCPQEKFNAPEVKLFLSWLTSQ